MTNVPASFLRESCTYLQGTYLPRLERALEALPEGDLWWRAHPEVVAFGTILLHLEGNVRQWIIAGLGEAPDERKRASEFAANEGSSGAELMAALTGTVHEACAVIAALEPARLDAPFTCQGYEMDGLGAILHVVEHFSWHTGQAVWIAKARAGAGHGIAFFDDAQVNEPGE
jgi:uncharacterized damage-inducible protein DinB